MGHIFLLSTDIHRCKMNKIKWLQVAHIGHVICVLQRHDTPHAPRPASPTGRRATTRASEGSMTTRHYQVCSLAAAIRHLDALRGRAQARSLNREDLLQALAEARRDGDYGLRAGATVANCYGYPAHRMRLVVIRRRRTYALLADWGNAKRGSSACPLGGRQSVWERQIRAAQRGTLPPAVETWWLIPAREVRRALAERRYQARLAAVRHAAEVWCTSAPDGQLVTAADSLSAGNCPRATERISQWWPERDSVSHAELRAAILRREPTLARFAVQAVEAAQRRQQGVA